MPYKIAHWLSLTPQALQTYVCKVTSKINCKGVNIRGISHCKKRKKKMTFKPARMNKEKAAKGMQVVPYNVSSFKHLDPQYNSKITAPTQP